MNKKERKIIETLTLCHSTRTMFIHTFLFKINCVIINHLVILQYDLWKVVYDLSPNAVHSEV